MILIVVFNEQPDFTFEPPWTQMVERTVEIWLIEPIDPPPRH